MTLKTVIEFGRMTVDKWNAHEVPRLSASLAFYTVLSLAPIILLLITVYGLAFGRTGAEEKLLDQVRTLAGIDAMNTFAALLGNMHKSSGGVLGTCSALLIFFFGASSVFGEIRDSLNEIWEVKGLSQRWSEIVWRRIVAFLLIAGVAIFLLLSLIVTSALHSAEATILAGQPAHERVLKILLNNLFSFAGLTIAFGLIFKIVPDAVIKWREVAVGALATALLFLVGRNLLAFYLTSAAVGSVYGAAGSIVALYVWIYYSAQTFFLGSVFTWVYANRKTGAAPPPLLKPKAGATAST